MQVAGWLRPLFSVAHSPVFCSRSCFWVSLICPCLPPRIKESSGWQQVFTSPYLDWTIERVALNAKVVGGPHGDKDKMVAVASESGIILWSVQDGGSGSEIGRKACVPHAPRAPRYATRCSGTGMAPKCLNRAGLLLGGSCHVFPGLRSVSRMIWERGKKTGVFGEPGACSPGRRACRAASAAQCPRFGSCSRRFAPTDVLR